MRSNLNQTLSSCNDFVSLQDAGKDDDALIAELERSIYGVKTPYGGGAFGIPDDLHPSTPEMAKYIELRKELVMNIAATNCDLDNIGFLGARRFCDFEDMLKHANNHDKFIQKFYEQVKILNDTAGYDVMEETEKFITDMTQKKALKRAEIFEIINDEWDNF